uniref:Uncharacterized protein n=1 Tax=Oryza nivara TaxID=4536 RepID=A0A0E0FV23_ORYNI
MVAPRSADAASMCAAPKVAPSSADDASLRAGSKKTLVALQIRPPIPARVEVEGGHAYPGGTATAGSTQDNVHKTGEHIVQYTSAMQR